MQFSDTAYLEEPAVGRSADVQAPGPKAVHLETRRARTRRRVTDAARFMVQMHYTKKGDREY